MVGTWASHSELDSDSLPNSMRFQKPNISFRLLAFDYRLSAAAAPSVKASCPFLLFYLKKLSIIEGKVEEEAPLASWDSASSDNDRMISTRSMKPLLFLLAVMTVIFFDAAHDTDLFSLVLFGMPGYFLMGAFVIPQLIETSRGSVSFSPIFLCFWGKLARVNYLTFGVSRIQGGNLKLADFGLDLSFSNDHNGNLTNRVLTLWYRAPQLFIAVVVQINKRRSKRKENKYERGFKSVTLLSETGSGESLSTR
ncbi:hypothetical protein POM88_018137 [Heracleum sosnowskyi]|uniref:Uncharacterized protein n=1 Tax=Heracleum sosnowskyi TaxID=360622 RepID=A0AAD8MYN4_9APIA|nr:hypothetical protein POM88_018137 [Heracleum sosnowskyi]